MDHSIEMHELAQMVAGVEEVHEVLQRALSALARVVPYDLAAVFRLSGSQARVVAAAGPLAEPAVQRHQIDLRHFPTIRRALETRRPIALEQHHHTSSEGDPYDGVLNLPSGHSCMVVPLFAGQQDLGLVTVDRRVCGTYSSEVLETAGVYGQLMSLTIHLADLNEAMGQKQTQLNAHNQLLIEDSELGRRGIDWLDASQNAQMRELVEHARQVASSHLPVLILGETGVGKEVVAQAIHAWSPRASQPYVKLNCSAIPEGLTESELFGHTKGAFSGADRARPGRFLTANGGTLLLDEIGDMPLAAQAKLLRVLQEGTFEPVGSDRSIKVNVRVIAATHQDLALAVKNGRFREDLYYRLAVFPLCVPPLRERREDILRITDNFLHSAMRQTRRGPWTLSARTVNALEKADWPGNVRELQNVLERAVLLVPRGEIDLCHLRSDSVAPPSSPRPENIVTRALDLSWEQNERRYLEGLLRACNGRLYGPEGAAERAKLKPTTLRSKLVRHGLR
jgi:transcriptional regulator with GAF, ATPase, and Fis domain